MVRGILHDLSSGASCVTTVSAHGASRGAAEEIKGKPLGPRLIDTVDDAGGKEAMPSSRPGGTNHYATLFCGIIGPAADILYYGGTHTRAQRRLVFFGGFQEVNRD